MSRKVRGKPAARDHHEVGEGAPVKWKGKAIRSGEEIAALPRREFLEVESGELRVALLFEIKRRREAEKKLKGTTRKLSAKKEQLREVVTMWPEVKTTLRLLAARKLLKRGRKVRTHSAGRNRRS